MFIDLYKMISLYYLQMKEENNQFEDSLGAKQRKEQKMKQIKKKSQNVREITHYFTKVEKTTSINKNIPTPDKIAIEQMDRNFITLQEQQKTLMQQIQEIKMKNESQKQQRQYFLNKCRNMICSELKKISQINRFFNGQNQLKLNQKRYQLSCLNQQINTKREISMSSSVNAFQKYFIMKQIERSQKELNRLSMQVSLLAEKHRVQMQEQSCYFAKEKWSIIAKRYQPLQLIGKGGFSEVYKAYDLYTNQVVAVKLSSVEHLLQNCGNKHEYLRHIKREYQIHKQLNHPNIVKLLEVIELQSALCIVLEYCDGFTLSEYLKMEGTLSEQEGKKIIMPLASVINYLNSQVPAIIHYDLKPQNIIFSQGIVKVLDFGICKIIDSQHSKMALTSQGVGTFWYLPPEVFASNNPLVSNKVDVWSLGVIFYQILFGKRPFGQKIPQKLQKTESFNLIFEEQIKLSSRCKDFINSCLMREQKRMSPVQLSNHPFILNIDCK